ncbi:MAG: ABC transporter permease [Reichenbachiella sp.]|uniref:ABC transporter permease n=1 Tax=Reichenbachiella sp. TaxID=2184521 RepID=UPI003266C921
MIKNYLKIAFRNLLKHKTFSLINIIGLAGGLTCCLLIFVFVSDELNYDRFQSKKDRIYRLQYFISNFNIASVPPVFAENLNDFFPEVEKATRLFTRNVSVQIDDPSGELKKFEEENIFFTDSSTFDIFDFEFLEGSSQTPLHEPFTAIITEELGQKYFGNVSPVGQVIKMEGKPFRISAVVKSYPNHSHFHFSMLVPYTNMFDLEPEPLGTALRQNFKLNWMVSHSYTYVLLKQGADPESVNSRFPDFVAKKIPENMQKGQSFKIQPLLDIHLDDEVAAQVEPPGSRVFLFVFMAIGALTLLIACINFVNLSTARSLQRTKEIGMRKVMGAWRSSLIAQFLGESFVTAGVAALVAFVASILLLPLLNEVTGKQLEYAALFDPLILMGYAGLFIVTSLLAGLYPAFFATRISPIYSLKGLSGENVRGGLSFRKGLIVIQFAISILLISGTLIVYDQLSYLQNKPLGLNKDYMVTVPVLSQNFNNVFGAVNQEKRKAMDAFEVELERLPGIQASTLSAGIPGSGAAHRNVIPEGFTIEDHLLAPVLSVDYDFIETYGIELLTGRDFSKEYETDPQAAFVINKTAVETYNFGSPQEALGKTINMEGKIGKVIGVTKDFNFMSLSQEMGPMILDIRVPAFTHFSFKINNQNISQTLASLEEIWNKHFPTETFDAQFLDELMAQNYGEQEQLGKLISNFSILAILISCLGSYGMILFLASQKMKEVGIRKVLGASVSGLVLLLSQRFVLLALVAMVMAIPAAHYLATSWLDEFAYRVEISYWNFAIASLVTLALVLITISFQSIKTATANPVKSLRQE